MWEDECFEAGVVEGECDLKRRKKVNIERRAGIDMGKCKTGPFAIKIRAEQ